MKVAIRGFRCSAKNGLLDLEFFFQTNQSNLKSAPSATTQEREATGRIEAVNADSLTISHSAVPSAQWGAMTMDFAAHDAAQLKGLKPGDRIRFRFHLAEDGTAMLSSVQPAGVEGGQR